MKLEYEFASSATKKSDEWSKIGKLGGSAKDFSSEISKQRALKKVDDILLEFVRKEKTITIPYAVDRLDIAETTTRRALGRLCKARLIKDRYEMRKTGDNVYHKHHVYFI
jgi:hypothetical protein